MGLFNHDRMKAAAWKRFENRIRRGDNEEEARQVWVRDSLSLDSISKVAVWLNERGISLHFDRRDGAVYSEDGKHVAISSALPLDTALVYLLHECGHVLIGSTGASKRYAMGYPKQNDPAYNRKFEHRLAVLEEEMEAWHRGQKLASRLKISWSIQKKLWDEKRLRCLQSYVKWTMKPGKFTVQ